MSHKNNGRCEHCAKIFDRYPGFHSGLRRWFEEFQAQHSEAHISCAGRGQLDQEAQVVRGTSRAHFGKSSHNWNAAIDIFELQGNIANIYERDWFDRVVAPEIPQWLTWYGRKGSPFFELPHVEVKAWRALAQDGELKLVEEKSDAA
jgi:hypothetical protein